MPWDRAARVGINVAVGIRAATRATGRATFDIAVHGGLIEGGTGAFLIFESPLFLGTVNFVKVSDAGIALGSAAGFDEIRDGDGSQKANDRHDNHDFDQRKTGGL